jgi:hypothetical protein
VDGGKIEGVSVASNGGKRRSPTGCGRGKVEGAQRQPKAERGDHVPAVEQAKSKEVSGKQWQKALLTYILRAGQSRWRSAGTIAERGDHLPAVERAKLKSVSGKPWWKRRDSDHVHAEGGRKSKECQRQAMAKERQSHTYCGRSKVEGDQRLAMA